MFDWKRIQLIAIREIRTRIATRTYRISLIVQVLIVSALALSPVVIAKFSGEDDGTHTGHILVVDGADVGAVKVLDTTLQLNVVGSDTTYDVTAADSADSARDDVDSGNADAAVIVQRQEGKLDFTIITSSGDAQGNTAQTLIAATSALAIQKNIDESGMSVSQIQSVFAPPAMETTAADPVANDSDDTDASEIVNFVIAYASTIIIFIFVVMYGQWISQGVVEEKASRIMEIMVNAATPRDLLAGKVIGIMITALMQFVPIVLTVGLIASFQTQIGSLLGVAEDQLFDIDFGSIAWASMGWFLLYFILGFLLFGALYAGIGSLVSRQEEVSTAVAPMTTVMMIGYFVALASLSNPDGIIARVAFLFPGTTVFVAMLRLVVGNPAGWEIAVSIGGLLVAIVLAMLFAARLYRVGVLMYGQAPKLSQLFRLGSMQQVSR